MCRMTAQEVLGFAALCGAALACVLLLHPGRQQPYNKAS